MKRFVYYFGALGLLSVVVLSGCMSLPKESLLSSWQGRFSVSVQNLQQINHESGRFELSLFPKDHLILDLKTPLGGTLARVEQFPSFVRLQALGQSPIEAPNSHDLMMQMLGFSVPIKGLTYWLNGIPDPTSPYNSQPQSFPYDRIEQDGWCIEITSRFQDSRPQKIRLIRAVTNNQPEITLTLVIQGT